jgi:hypothetical protein
MPLPSDAETRSNNPVLEALDFVGRPGRLLLGDSCTTSDPAATVARLIAGRYGQSWTGIASETPGLWRCPPYFTANQVSPRQDCCSRPAATAPVQNP